MCIRDSSTPSWEFYDLRTDPHENRNQYGNPAYTEVIGAMKREMLELRRQYKDTDEGDRKSTRLNSSHLKLSRMPSSA